MSSNSDCTMKRYLIIILNLVFAICSCTNNQELPTPPELPDCTVYVNFGSNGATATIPTVLKKYVTDSIVDNYVWITSIDTTHEIKVVLAGSSSDGAFVYKGNYKCAVALNGVSLKSNKGAALDIECGKRISLILTESTTNTLEDMASGTQKACLYCKGHMEIKGAGSLNITANTKHGICTKEYLQLKNSTGAITFNNIEDDAIHVGDSDDPAEEKVDEYFQMNGGSITATISKNQDSKGIRVAGDVMIKGGTININANSNGSRGIQTDGNMVISEEFEGTSTKITISAAGGKCTLPACALGPHKCMGIKIDGNLTVNGGTTKVTNTGKKSKGIKVAGTYTKNGGTVDANIDNGEN